ncbi:MAG TPA: permease [Gemmatimonas sp.]|uniref:permease n=1 Tax=Gemmatimonas sp. TaxID=1962908 RepID=UPI002EDABD48
MSVSALLPASLGALVIGPLLSRFARSRPPVIAFVDGFIVVSIGGLVLLDVVPHALEHRDVIAMLCMALGYLVPGMAEKLLRYGVRQTHSAILTLALLGVAVHSVLDGSALAQSQTQPGSLLGYGVLLHQIPVGLTVWWVLRDRARVVSWLVLSMMAIMTVAGYVAEPTVLAWLPDRAALWFEALVGGSLLHVIGHATHEHDDDEGHQHGHGHDHADTHAHAHTPAHGGAHAHAHTHAHEHEHQHEHTAPSGPATSMTRASGAGSLLGLAVLAALQLLGGRDHDEHAVGIADALWEFTVASAPAVLFAYGAIAVLDMFRATRGWTSLTFGMRGDATRTAALPHRTSNGALSLEAALLSVPLLGVALALVRLAAAQLLSVLVLRAGVSTGNASPDTPEPGYAWRDAIEQSAPWIILGLMMAAVLAPVLPQSWITRLPQGVDVLLLAVLGSLVCMHAAALVPIGAVLLASGVSPGAVIALLLLAPLPHLRAHLATRGADGAATGVRLYATTLAIAVGVGLALNVADGTLRIGAWTGFHGAPENGVALSAGALMVLLYVWVLARRGIRGFLEPLRQGTS